MQHIRQQLSWMLCFWLASQALALAAPVVLAVSGSAPVEALCTCPGGDHDTCPMHHGKDVADSPGSAICGIRSCNAPIDAALLSMAGGPGLIPESADIPQPRRGSIVFTSEPRSFAIAASHDTPPPRL